MIETKLTEQQTFPERLSKQSFGFWFFIGAILFSLTQIVRGFVLSTNQQVFLNDKFAFSLNVPLPLMYLLYLGAVIFIGHYLVTHWSRMFSLSKFGFLLIITGGFSNVLERIIFGKVVDYFFILTGVLNLADLYIILGIIIIFAQRGYKD